MPGPGRGGRGWGGRGHHGGGRGLGWGPRPGPFLPVRPIFRPVVPVGRGLGVIGAVATGAVIAATLPPRQRRYPMPSPGYIYVVQANGPPRAVAVQEASFIVRRIDVPSVAQGTQGEVFYHVQVGTCRVGKCCVSTLALSMPLL